MSERACPSELELSRALTIGAAPELAAHLASCAPCRGAWDGLRSAIEHARELPVRIPSASQLEDVRTALLAASARGTADRRKRRWVVPALAIAAVAGVVIQLARPAPVTAPPPVVARGVVHPHPGARYELTAPPDEIVALHDGTIDVQVDPLGPGDRFRVVVGHDEVEVRGTAFEVVAATDQLVAVHVVHGRVEVRRVAAPAIALLAGEEWHAPVAIARTEPLLVVPPPGPAPQLTAPRNPVPRTAHRPEVPPTPPIRVPEAATSPDELAYVRAWNAMRRNDFIDAAAAFTETLERSPDGPLAEDASYWFAVSTARIPQPAHAITGFRDFLDHYAHSPHAGEASAVLGWLLLDRGERTEARRRFETALANGSESVRASARAGLDELARR